MTPIDTSESAAPSADILYPKYGENKKHLSPDLASAIRLTTADDPSIINWWWFWFYAQNLFTTYIPYCSHFCQENPLRFTSVSFLSTLKFYRNAKNAEIVLEEAKQGSWQLLWKTVNSAILSTRPEFKKIAICLCERLLKFTSFNYFFNSPKNMKIHLINP